MAEKARYWDMHRCAWVDAEPTDGGLPVPEPAADAVLPPAADVAVPEQRPDLDASLVAGTPD